MTLDELLGKMNPEICAALKQAVELGKWANGEALSREQKAQCLQAVILYEQSHGVAASDRVGYVAPRPVDNACHSRPLPGDVSSGERIPLMPG